MQTAKKPLKTPRLSIVAAIGEQRELGKKNELIWRIRDDLRRVKSLTTGHPIIMGRATYESIGRALPNRTNIVLTSDAEYTAEGCVVVHSLEEALQRAEEVEDEEIFIFGGARVYQQALDRVDRLYLTLIHDTDREADTFFPDYTEFSKEVEQETRDQDGLAYEWLTLERE